MAPQALHEVETGSPTTAPCREASTPQVPPGTRARPSRTDEIELQRRAIQAELDGARSSPERNRVGQFATPPRLAAELASYAAPLIRSERVRFLDPAVGSGAFYSAFRARLGPERFDRAVGVELDPRFARAARRLWGPLGLKVRSGDFTQLPPPPPRGRFDLVVANPPYVRHHHLPAADKQRLRKTVAGRTGLALSGLAGLYCHFMLLADAWLAPGGLAVWLVPAELLDVNYGSTIREYLTQRVRLVRVHRFDPVDLQFEDALVTSAAIVFRQAPPGGTCTFSAAGSPRHPGRTRRVPLGQLATARKWAPVLAAERQRPRQGAPRLGDLFTIRRGIATGANAFFIRDRLDALAAGVPPHSLRPLMPSPRELASNVIESDPDGWPTLPRQRALLDIRDSPAVVRRKHPELWSLIETAEAAGLNTRYLTSRRTPWYAQERRSPPPFLCTYMGRAAHRDPPFRFLLNRSRAVATNVYLLLDPTSALTARFGSTPDPMCRVHEGLAAIASTELVSGGRVYGGGLHKLEPRELAEIDATPLLDHLSRMSRRR